LRELGASIAGPVLAFSVLLSRLLLPPEADRGFITPLLFASVVLGAVFGGRRAALATAALAAIGLWLGSSEGFGLGTALSIAVAFAIGVVTGELRDRADRAERDTEVANARLRRLALRDALTGLLDRRGFDYALGVELARETRRGGHFALLVIELVRLDTVNERLGRSIGDTLLQVFADALEQRIRQSDIAARVGGDDFAVILPDTDARGAEIVASGIITSFRTNVAGIIPDDVGVSATFGIARFPEDGRASDQLLTAAAGRAAAVDSPADPL